jgi:ankyrin repeat protein
MSASLIADFIDAAVRDHDLATRLLAKHPELLNARWLHDETVLHFLASEGFGHAVTWLAQQGADVDAVNKFGDTALIDTVFLGIESIAGTLLQYGANPNVSSRTRGTPLQEAVQRGHDGIVALLLAAGADARFGMDEGETIFDELPASEPDRENVLAVLARYEIIPEDADQS